MKKLNFNTDTTSVKIRASNIKTGETKDYSSIAECCRSLDFRRDQIHHVLKGHQKTASNRKDKIKYKFEKNLNIFASFSNTLF